VFEGVKGVVFLQEGERKRSRPKGREKKKWRVKKEATKCGGISTRKQ